MARTAAVVGTATATRNAVNRRQADKNMAAYSQAAAANAPQQQVVYAAPPPEVIPAQAPAAPEDPITQLERLGALKAQGLLTDEEFNAQKAKILGL
jgi:hypothetical protein